MSSSFDSIPWGFITSVASNNALQVLEIVALVYLIKALRIYIAKNKSFSGVC